MSIFNHLRSVAAELEDGESIQAVNDEGLNYTVSQNNGQWDAVANNQESQVRMDEDMSILMDLATGDPWK